MTLALDASTYVGTAAVFRGRELLAEAETPMRGTEREGLMLAVGETVRSAGVSAGDIERVVCGGGPGSFTSLRIAASIAKGIAMGVGCRLYSVSSLALIVAGESARAPGKYLAVLDALRGQAYVGAYEVDERGALREVAPTRLVQRGDVASLARDLGTQVIGPDEAIVARPHARGALSLSFETDGPVGLASWEPSYGRKAEAQSRWEAAHGAPLPRE